MLYGVNYCGEHLGWVVFPKRKRQKNYTLIKYCINFKYTSGCLGGTHSTYQGNGIFKSHNNNVFKGYSYTNANSYLSHRTCGFAING
jgi:hypothetical protein